MIVCNRVDRFRAGCLRNAFVSVALHRLRILRSSIDRDHFRSYVRLMTDHYPRLTGQLKPEIDRRGVSSRSRRKSESPCLCNSMTLGRLVLRSDSLQRMAQRIVLVNDSGTLLYYPPVVGAPPSPPFYFLP